MKQIAVAVLVVLLLTGVVGAVPYPYGEYVLDGNRDPAAVYDEIHEVHKAPITAEGDSVYPWTELSFASLTTPALIEAEVNRDAAHNFWTATEKTQKHDERYAIYVDDSIHFWVLLVADPNTSHGYRYVEPDGHKTYISRIVLETSDGKRYTPNLIYGGDADLVERHWLAVTSIWFPRYDEGEQIINESTEWIRLWFITGTDRAYFQFDFENKGNLLAPGRIWGLP
ncbi:MAG: hypothetical protein M0Q40_10585 [Limnochordia bacterium]|nr:hypothetical protein [Limnochordia bacterium]MDD4517896.1 hypothetical protein [Limnochordia bacterium]